uniref:Uncharacterized protein n=1 Tax=Anguilla anguilla TaxID=7936 RepID=A0A0E9UNM6_ANGAN
MKSTLVRIRELHSLIYYVEFKLHSSCHQFFIPTQALCLA